MTTTSDTAPRLTATQADDLLTLVNNYAAAVARAASHPLSEVGHARWTAYWHEADAAQDAVRDAVHALAGQKVTL